jgi:hypothetical protein
MAYQDPYSKNYNYNNAGYSEPQYNYASQPATYPPYDAGAGAAEPSGSGPAIHHNYSSSYSSNVEKRNTRASFGVPPK